MGKAKNIKALLGIDQNANISYESYVGLVYARVSTKRQEIEGSGLTSQEDRCKMELAHMHVSYERSFLDSYSGGGDFMKRPAMRELIDYIDAHPYKKFVLVFDDLKRFARDVEFHLKLRAALQTRGVVLRCLNYTFSETPEGRHSEILMASNAELDRHTNRRQVVQRQLARLQKGCWAFGRKRGYSNIYQGDHCVGEFVIRKD